MWYKILILIIGFLFALLFMVVGTLISISGAFCIAVFWLCPEIIENKDLTQFQCWIVAIAGFTIVIVTDYTYKVFYRTMRQSIENDLDKK